MQTSLLSVRSTTCIAEQKESRVHHITKLFVHGDADHDHLLRSVLKIPCTKNYHYYYHFIKIPLRVSQGTVATFYSCVGQSYHSLFPFFQNSTYQNLLKSVHF